MTARHSLIILLGLWATLALALKARPGNEAPIGTDLAKTPLRRVELEAFRAPRPILFVGACEVPIEKLMADGQSGDQSVRILATAEQTQVTRQHFGAQPVSSTVEAPGLMFRLAGLSLSSPQKPPVACSMQWEHELGDTVVLRLRVIASDGAATEQTATAHFGNCECLRSGTEAVDRVNQVLRRAGLQI